MTLSHANPTHSNSQQAETVKATFCQAFSPVVNSNSQVLILGSIPGARSLKQQEYYAQKQNSFWNIIQELFGIERSTPYEERLQQLLSCNLALWDVVESCQRPGSLDSKIASHSVVANDIQTLLDQNPRIKHICFNGKKAAELFKKHIQLQPRSKLSIHNLPSTSAAHAAMRPAQKLEKWKIIQELLAPPKPEAQEDEAARREANVN